MGQRELTEEHETEAEHQAYGAPDGMAGDPVMGPSTNQNSSSQAQTGADQ